MSYDADYWLNYGTPGNSYLDNPQWPIVFGNIAAKLKRRFPQSTISLCTTSGELCNAPNALYCATGERWDRIVLQLFDDSVIASADSR